jgi:glucose-6-phosphate dehydrogenase assembly protein OpcA
MSSEYIVHPSQIESQLATIWSSLQGTGKTRACLFTLVIYTHKNKRIDYFYKVAQKVIGKFPSRIIFVTINDEAPPETLKTSVAVISSESVLNPTNCDLINISLSAENRERAPFMILPHILADLPVYLLWADDPSKNDPVSQKLGKLATRVIFDSECADNLSSFAKAAIKHKEASGSDIADLNWARIEGWRQLFAETFKSQDRLSMLRQISTVKIYYNNSETEFFCHNKIQALYLQGWLSLQMKWVFKSSKINSEDTVLEYNNQGSKILITLSPMNFKEVSPGAVLEVHLLGNDDQAFHFTRSAQLPHIINIKYSTNQFCLLPTQFIFDRYESGQSLVKEIFHKGTSSHYLSLLKTLSSFSSEALK